MPSLSEIKPLAIRLLKTEGAFLAAIPFVGSLIALEYEEGYLSFFDVPTSVIQLDLIRIISISIVLAFMFFGLLLLLDLIVAVVDSKHPIRQALLTPLLFALILGIVLTLSSAPATKWWSLAIVVIVAGATEFVPPLFKKEAGTTYLERLSKSLSEETQRMRAQSASTNKLTYGRQLTNFVALTLFCMMIVFTLGHKEAENKSDYWVMANDPAKLFVRKYGDLLVFKSFDPQSKQVGSELSLLKLSDSRPIILKKIHTEKLQAAKQIQASPVIQPVFKVP